MFYFFPQQTKVIGKSVGEYIGN